MKTSLLCMLSLLLAATTAAAQENMGTITTSLGMVKEAPSEERAGPAADVRKSNAILSLMRPVTVEHKATPWFLLVVQAPDEKQVVHFTQEQLKTIRAIVDAKDGKTHYLPVTNFFDVLSGEGSAVTDDSFVSSVQIAIQKRHRYKNNALFLVSSQLVDGEHVVRFKFPFANEAKVCRHLKAVHNLEEAYHEATPDAFMGLFTPSAAAFASGKID